jgi:hypothetical protein
MSSHEKLELRMIQVALSQTMPSCFVLPSTTSGFNARRVGTSNPNHS